MGTDRQLQFFWLLMEACCSWDIVGGFSSYVFGGGGGKRSTQLAAPTYMCYRVRLKYLDSRGHITNE